MRHRPALIVEQPTLAGLTAAAPELLYAGVLSSALTFGLFSIALAHIPGPRASIILSTETVFAAIGAAIILSEWLSPLGMAGAAMIVAAVLVVQTQPTK